jgi:DNA (cytosine-5)-methyltransferase 1
VKVDIQSGFPPAVETALSVPEAAAIDILPADRLTVFEFFSGGGLVRLGLGDSWRHVGAIDNDRNKVESYRTNFGPDGLIHDDIRNLKPDAIPGTLDLAWASFPCTNVSVAGNRTGLDGEASGAFWPCWSIIQRLVDQGRAPGVIAIENVRNLLVSGGGRDCAAILGAMVAAGYSVGALLVDARLCVPQSRKRLFIIGVRADVPMPIGSVLAGPSAPFHTTDLIRMHADLPASVRKRWVWWNLPVPEKRDRDLGDILDPDESGTAWHTEAETADLVSTMGPHDLDRVRDARASGERKIGTIYVRSRTDVTGRRRRANTRFDGLASCLVMPNGAASSQMILVVENDLIRTRFMTGREGARLMGVPPTYRLPRGYNATFELLGDGVVVPVVTHLSQHLLEPLAATVRSLRPRTESVTAVPEIIESKSSGPSRSIKTLERSGIKGSTVGTTVYLKPEESKRLRRLALELDLSLHDLLLTGLDRLLAENGQRPVSRYERAAKTVPVAIAPGRKSR